MRLYAFVFPVILACSAIGTHAAPLAIELAPSATNPANPQMGDHLSFHSVIRNDGTTPVEGIIAWLSLVQTDKGKEQPIDLEDWSAHKAVTIPALAPGQNVQTDWPIRLIQAGNYRVAISAMMQGNADLAASAFAAFTVREKPVVESARVLPIAFGMPALLALLLFWRWRRG